MFVQAVRSSLKRLPDFDELYKGLHAYLFFMHRYHEAFENDSMPFVDVIQSLSFVMHFMRYWHAYLEERQPVASIRRRQGLTPQTTLHMEISCAAAINTIGLIQHFNWCPGLPITLGNMVCVTVIDFK